MNLRKHGILFGLYSLLALLALNGNTASAQEPLGLGLGYLFGYGANNTPVVRTFVPAPPYFSLHPPVYYGKRYSRPYGESPFASWPQLRSPADYMPQPAAKYVQPLVINLPAYHAPMEVVPQSIPVSPSPAHPADTAPIPAPVPAQAPVLSPVVINNPYYLDAISRAQLVSQP